MYRCACIAVDYHTLLYPYTHRLMKYKQVILYIYICMSLLYTHTHCPTCLKVLSIAHFLIRDSRSLPLCRSRSSISSSVGRSRCGRVDRRRTRRTRHSDALARAVRKCTVHERREITFHRRFVLLACVDLWYIMVYYGILWYNTYTPKHIYVYIYSNKELTYVDGR